MVEVVATVLTACLLHGDWAVRGLVAHHDALLEGGVEVFAAVATVHGDLHGVELVL